MRASWPIVNLALLVVLVAVLARVTAGPLGVRHVLTALTFVLCLQVAIVLHELAHGLTARRLGATPVAYTLTGAGGYTTIIHGHRGAVGPAGPASHRGPEPAEHDNASDRAGTSLAIAIAGPLANAVIGALCVLLAGLLASAGPRLVPPGTGGPALPVGPGTPMEFVTWPLRLAALPLDGLEQGLSLAWWVVAVTAATHLVLALTNLLPMAPLDGSAVLEAAWWGMSGRREAARRVAAVTTIVLAVLLALALVGAVALRAVPAVLVAPGLVVLAGAVAGALERPPGARDGSSSATRRMVGRDH